MELFDIPDFTGYKVSKNGKVYSVIPKGCRNRFDKSKWVEPKELAVRKTKKGYCRVYMRRDSTGLREDVYIHRIVAELFVANPYNLPEINHKDCNPSNNDSSNLEWTSHRNNLEYALIHGHMGRNNRGQFCYK